MHSTEKIPPGTTRSSLSTRLLGTQNVLSSLAGQPMLWPHVLPVELLAFPWQLQSWSEGKACNTRLPIAVWQCELQCGRAIILILFIWGHWWIWSWEVSHLLHEQALHSMWPQHEGRQLEARAQFPDEEGRCSTSQLFRSIGVVCIQTAWQSHFLSFQCIYCVFHPFAAIACSSCHILQTCLFCISTHYRINGMLHNLYEMSLRYLYI